MGLLDRLIGRKPKPVHRRHVERRAFPASRSDAARADIWSQIMSAERRRGRRPRSRYQLRLMDEYDAMDSFGDLTAEELLDHMERHGQHAGSRGSRAQGKGKGRRRTGRHGQHAGSRGRPRQ